MISSILAIGCSFTYGLELPDAPAFAFNVGDLTPSKFSYPALLAKKLTAELTNLSLPGGSNNRIFRLVMDQSLKKKYDLILCGWTGLGRLDVQYRGVDFPITSNSRWLDQEHPWIKQYFADYYSEEADYQTWIGQLISLQNHFKTQNQQYLFVSMGNTWACPPAHKFYHMFQQVDRKYFPGFGTGSSMVDWMGDCPKGPGGHPLELGHERIADKIYEHIGNLGWLS